MTLSIHPLRHRWYVESVSMEVLPQDIPDPEYDPADEDRIEVD